MRIAFSQPDWDKLANEYKNSESVLIADVDCTAAGEPLCKTHGVSGYPTIKTFASASAEGEDYSGGRSISALRAHAEGLGPPVPMPLAHKAGLGIASLLVIWIAGQIAHLW